ncbi:MAG: Ger(x)C family spore germination protein [Syntrophomonadaceae bacterium]|nr:Ger(x)C family spore germination protein [Syntrophomonadaceae bacterium]
MKSDKTIPILTNRGMRLVLLLLLVSSLFLNGGCWNKVEVIDTIQAEGLVFDLENDLPVMSIQLAKSSGNGESTSSQSNEPLIITQTGRSFTECARNTMLRLPRLPVWSHAGVIVLGEDLVHQDMALLTDFMARNRHVRKTSLLFVCKGMSGRECSEAELLIEKYSLAGLERLIRTQEKELGIYMPVITHSFLEKLATPGVQPAVPQISLYESEGKKLLQLDGMAVFKDRRQVGSLDEFESRGYRFLSPKMISGGFFNVSVPDQDPSGYEKLMAIELTRSRATISPLIEGDKISHIQISIEAEGNFYEQNFIGELLTLDNAAIIEELINQEIKRQITAAIVKAQALNSDIFGWGHMIYQQNPALWEQLENNWPATFAGLDADITVDFSLRRTYLLDHSFEFRE